MRINVDVRLVTSWLGNRATRNETNIRTKPMTVVMYVNTIYYSITKCVNTQYIIWIDMFETYRATRYPLSSWALRSCGMRIFPPSTLPGVLTVTCQSQHLHKPEFWSESPTRLAYRLPEPIRPCFPKTCWLGVKIELRSSLN